MDCDRDLPLSAVKFYSKGRKMKRRAGTAEIVLMLLAVLASCEQASDHFEVWFANEPESDCEIIEFSLEKSPGTWEVSLHLRGKYWGKENTLYFPCRLQRVRRWSTGLQ